MNKTEHSCENSGCAAYDRIGNAMDRFQEAHLWIHLMERHYHDADPFRWYVNVFLKALKEVPQLIEMALQNDKGFKVWYKPKKAALRSDPLMSALAKNRDFVVHQGMLELNSGGAVGISELRGMKLGFSFPVHPLEDSEAAMERYVQYAAVHGDFFDFLQDDDDSLPCVERTWRIPGFDDELIDLCATAWIKTGEHINDVVTWLGADDHKWELTCRHSANRVRFKLFNRAKLQARLAELTKAQPTLP